MKNCNNGLVVQLPENEGIGIVIGSHRLNNDTYVGSILGSNGRTYWAKFKLESSAAGSPVNYEEWKSYPINETLSFIENWDMSTMLKTVMQYLVKANYLKQEIEKNKDYWIQKAQKEAGFEPAEGDWVFVDITLFKVEISVHHKHYGGAKYWKNGKWVEGAFDTNYPLPNEYK